MCTTIACHIAQNIEKMFDDLSEKKTFLMILIFNIHHVVVLRQIFITINEINSANYFKNY